MTTDRHWNVTGHCDECGAVYVEFLVAFIPLFLLFLGICQLVLAEAARVVVSHAAVAAVRSAIVVLEDPRGDEYDDAPLGNLSDGRPSSHGFSSLNSLLGDGDLGWLATDFSSSIQPRPRQKGARMAPIQLAAYVPLLTLAPDLSSLSASTPTLERSVSSRSLSEFGSAIAYTKAAAAVTVHSSEADAGLANEPMSAKGNVTVRVTYLHRCSVPVVRVLMCNTLSRLLQSDSNNRVLDTERLKLGAEPERVKQWVPSSERFIILSAVASLPNQGTTAKVEADE